MIANWLSGMPSFVGAVSSLTPFARALGEGMKKKGPLDRVETPRPATQAEVEAQRAAYTATAPRPQAYVPPEGGVAPGDWSGTQQQQGYGAPPKLVLPGYSPTKTFGRDMFNALAGNQLQGYLNFPNQMQQAMNLMWDVNKSNQQASITNRLIQAIAGLG